MAKYIILGILATALISLLLINDDRYVASDVALVEDEHLRYVPFKDIYFLEDLKKEYTLEQVLRSDTARWERGNTGSAKLNWEARVWFRIKMANNTKEQRWVLELRNPFALETQAFRMRNGFVSGHYNFGTAIPFKDRNISYRYPVQEFFVVQGDTLDLILAMSSGGAPNNFTTSFIQSGEFSRKSQNEILSLGAYFGLLFVSLLFLIGWYVRFKEFSIVFYIGVVFFNGLKIFLSLGLWQYAALESLMANGLHLDFYVQCLAEISTVWYSIYELNLKKHTPKTYWVLMSLLVLVVLQGFLAPFDYQMAMLLNYASILVGLFVLIVVSIYRKKQGYKYGWLMAIGWFSLFLAFLGVLGCRAGLLFQDPLIWLLVGTTSQMFFFSFQLYGKLQDKKEAKYKEIQMLREDAQPKEVERKSKIELVHLVEERTAELSTLNNRMNEGLRYAKRIQQAMKPAEIDLQKNVSDAFVLLKPCDIVSGDTYWFCGDNDTVSVAAIDCTGHGVPGAMMSMIAQDLLNIYTRQGLAHEPAKMLDYMRENVIKNFATEGDEIHTMDGMDAAICVLDKKTKRLSFSGALLPLFRFGKNGLQEYEPNRFPVGNWAEDFNRPFESTEIDVEDGDTFYLFSDGMQSQFGGPKNKKFTKKRMRALLHEAVSLPMSMQKLYIAQKLEEWKGENDQTDDILMIGFRI